jgi:hypothetical protein
MFNPSKQKLQMNDTSADKQNPMFDLIWNEKFWAEIIAFFPSIRHGPQRKHVRKFLYYCVFVAAETFLPSRCLAMIRGYTCRHTD